ncbi:hydroxyacid dehydrogenase [[Eubacterium] cellulosolvens]
MNILISDPIDEQAVKELGKFSTLLRKGEEEKADIVIVRSATVIDKAYVNKAKNLKMIIRAGVGLDNIRDIEYCRKKGIRIEHTAEASSIAVAELAIGHMIAIARKIPVTTEDAKKCKWPREDLVGFELCGKTLGIIGLGRIGKEVAKRAESFGMIILAYDPYITNSKYKMVKLQNLLKQSDIISLHVPLNENTRFLLDKKEFRMMKKGAVLINTSRGDVINEDELIRNLRSGKISFAGLDVYSKRLIKNSSLNKMGNIILTPHIGAQTIEARERIGKAIVEKVKNFQKDSEGK